MAGSVIKGITVVINGETTQLSKALSKLREQTKGLKGELQGVNKLLKADPTNLTLIGQKQAILNRNISEYQKKLDAAVMAEREAFSKRSQWSEADRRNYEALQREVESTKQRISSLTDEAVAFGSAASAGTIAAREQYSALADTLENAGKKLMVLSAGTTLIGGYAVYAAAKYESAFAGVRKTVDATDREFEDLSDTIRQMALEKPIDATDVAYAAELGGQLGIAVENLGQFASVIADLDVATNLDLEDASMKLAQFANIANIGEENFDRLGSVIVDLGNNSATTESKIMNMAMRIAGSGSNIGLTAQEILALATSLSSVGIEAEMGGNAISTIMNRIDKDVATANDTLQVWADTAGMSAEAFKAAWENDDTVMDAFMAVVDGMATYRDEGGNLNLLLKDMEISYMRQVDTMQRLSRTGDIVNEMVGIANKAWDENIALTREANRRYETTENQLRIVKNNFKEIAMQLGEIMTPSLKEFSGSLVDVLQDFQNLDDSTKQSIVKFLAFATAAGPVTLALSGVAKGMSWLVGLYAKGVTNLALLTRGTATFAGAANAAAAATARAAAKTKIMNTALSLSGTLMAGAVIAGIGLMIKGFMDAAEKERDFTDATENLADSIYAVGDSARDAQREMDSFSTGKAQRTFRELRKSIDETIESQAQLARDMEETWGDVNGDAAALQIYIDTIDQLTNKYGEHDNKLALTRDEQEKLIAAVNGYNEIMGTSYSVIDAQNGILDVSTDKLLANADAWIANARAQAAQEMMVELQKDQIQLEEDLAEAQRQHNEAMAEYGEMMNAGLTGDALGVYADRVAETGDAVEDATKLIDENVEAQQRLIDIQYEAQQTLTGTAEALGGFISGSEMWTQTLDELGINVDALSERLSALGFTTTDLYNMTEEQVAVLAANFGLTAEEIVAVYEELGITVPEKLAQAVANSSTAIEENSPVVTDAAAKVKKRVVNEFDMKGDLYSAGKNGIQGLSNAFSEDSAEKSGLLSAVSGLARSVLNTFYSVVGQGSPWRTMIESGKFGVEGLGEGISKYSYIAEDEAANLGYKTVAAIGNGIGSGDYQSALSSIGGNARVPSHLTAPASTEMLIGNAVRVALQDMSSGSGSPINQTINFNQPVRSAAETARIMRQERTYGLAGAR